MQHLSFSWVINHMYKISQSLPAFIWYFAKQFKAGLTVIACVSFVWSADLIIRPYLLKMMIDAIANNSNHHDVYYKLILPSIGYVSMLIILAGAFCIFNYASLKVYPKMKESMLLELMKNLKLQSYEFFQNQLGGNIANKVYDLTNYSEQIIQLILNGFLPSILVIIATIIALFFVHPYFALVMLIWVVIFFLMNYLLSKNAENLSKDFSASRNQLMGKVVDTIGNIINVKLFARNNYEIMLINDQLKDVTIREQKLGWGLLFIHLFQNALTVILTVILITLLIFAKQRELITAGDFVLVLSLTFAISDSVKTLLRSYIDFTKEIGICKQALSVINLINPVMDKPYAKVFKIKSGKIVFENVSFYYMKENKLFDNQNIIIPEKKKIGLVGYSGSGKSTLVNLIIRLYNVNSGRILIDGQDVVNVTQDSLRENISFISQDPVLFHRSIIENICYGKLGATYEEVIRAAKKAHAHEFIMKTQYGYETIVGERGVKLSVGQRQRIVIARAILKNAPILILDEATSALDSLTESLIQGSLKVLMKDKTVIVIAHRLSTLLTMDKIYVLDKGVITENGTHYELLRNKGLYSILWHSQSNGFIPNEK